MGKIISLTKRGIQNLKEYGFRDTFKKAKMVVGTKLKTLFFFSKYSKKPKSFAVERKKYRLEYKDFIDSCNNKKVLVILHIFYMDAWVEIKDYLKNLDCYNYDLIVTYVDAFKKQKVLNDIVAFKPDAIVMAVENKGYDLGPFIYALKDVDVTKYDVVFKMHGKSIYRPFIFIYDQIFKGKDWFLQLWDGVLGPKTVHETMQKLIEDNSIGLVAADNLIVQDPLHKQHFTISMAKTYGIDVPNDYQYVAGTCFATKGDAMQIVKGLNIPKDAFKKAKSGCFSYAHMLERLLCIVIGKQYKLSGNEVQRNIYAKELVKYQKLSSIRLLSDSRFKIDYEFFYKVLESCPVYDYELVEVKIGDIRRLWKGQKLTIPECHAYKYLMGDKDQYLDYCKENQLLDFDMTIDRFDELIKDLEACDYANDNIIVVDENNMLKDGQHRLAILCKEYGIDYKVKVLRLYCGGPKK
ncbi:MAG: hypothetical protein J6V40_03450 [Clostridia bacterium]|nr:hypothetical protein [Clostridia bacterium]